MAEIGLRDLLEAGVHFGHQTRKWNPKMRPYIFIARNGIYIIDLQKTLRAIRNASNFLQKVASKGGTVLFVGTKKQAKVAVRDMAERCGMPYVTERWLGGMLTNWQTISKRVAKLDEIESLRNTGKIEQFSKKEQLEINRSFEKLNKNLGGIRTMKGLPSAVFVIDTVEEETAVREANKLGIPVIGIVDTNSDPDIVHFPIPGNDDAIRAISLYARVVADAIAEGRSARTEGEEVAVEVQPDAPEVAKPTKVTLDDVDSGKSEEAIGQ
ncbi:30S ribosomal protein S2 [bacterium]|nr:30S ribosomal protein S2 [bacterium]MBU1072733.1 30S ribosomal protein S2 [bacterium]MBU1674316.1 30S ribosomal protein S2 [bacterium]